MDNQSWYDVITLNKVELRAKHIVRNEKGYHIMYKNNF